MHYSLEYESILHDQIHIEEVPNLLLIRLNKPPTATPKIQ